MRNPFDIKNYVADGAIVAHRIVKCGGADWEVAQATAADEALIGIVISPLDIADGQRIDVAHAGIADVELGGDVTRGGAVTADEDGKAVAAAPADGVNARAVGFALCSGVAGDIIPVKISLHSMQGTA